MANNINLSSVTNLRSNNISFKGAANSNSSNSIDNDAHTNRGTVKDKRVPAETVLAQLGGYGKNIKQNSAKIPTSVEEIISRLNKMNPNITEIDSNNPIVSMEYVIEGVKEDVATTKYVEYTDAGTPNSKFTVYETGENGKYYITEQSTRPDWAITYNSGKFDIYYDKYGYRIADTYYDSKTNIKENTRIYCPDGMQIIKHYNPDGSVKNYCYLNTYNRESISYDDKGRVTGLYMRDIHVTNRNNKYIDVNIERTSDNTGGRSPVNESKWTTQVDGTTIVEFRHGKYNYCGYIDLNQGLINVTETGKATQPKTEMSQEKAEILANAGFSEDIIGDLKLQSTFYGPNLIDEVLDMVVYLEEEIAKGTSITAKFLENTINKFSPAANMGSASVQLSILANTWNKGEMIKKLY